MDTTTEVFSPEELANTDGRQLEHLLNSHGYQSFFQPLIIGLIQRCYKELADPSVARVWKKPDDYLRGAIFAAEAILNAPRATLDIQRVRAAEDARAEKEAHQYDGSSGGGQYGRSTAAISPTDPV